MRATLTIERKLPAEVVARIGAAVEAMRQLAATAGVRFIHPGIVMYDDDKAAQQALTSGMASAEKELDAAAAKIGMKPGGDPKFHYGFSGDSCWYQRTYSR